MGVLMPSPEWQLDYYRHWIYLYLCATLTMTRMTGGTKTSKDVFKPFFSGSMRWNWCRFPPKLFHGPRSTKVIQEMQLLTGWKKPQTCARRLVLRGNPPFAASAALSGAHAGDGSSVTVIRCTPIWPATALNRLAAALFKLKSSQLCVNASGFLQHAWSGCKRTRRLNGRRRRMGVAVPRDARSPQRSLRRPRVDHGAYPQTRTYGRILAPIPSAMLHTYTWDEAPHTYFPSVSTKFPPGQKVSRCSTQ